MSTHFDQLGGCHRPRDQEGRQHEESEGLKTKEQTLSSTHLSHHVKLERERQVWLTEASVAKLRETYLRNNSSNSSGDTVCGGKVARREDLARDDEGCGVGAGALEEVNRTVGEDESFRSSSVIG
jgi:hypothetical protein